MRAKFQGYCNFCVTLTKWTILFRTVSLKSLLLSFLHPCYFIGNLTQHITIKLFYHIIIIIIFIIKMLKSLDSLVSLFALSFFIYVHISFISFNKIKI